MTSRDPNTVDLMQQRVRLAEDVKFWPVHERGELVYRLEIPSLHKFFRVGYEEYVLISLLDGETTLPQACGLAASVMGSRAPSSASAEAILRWLLSNELAYLEADDPPTREPAAAATRSAGSTWWKRLNPFWMKVPLPWADQWMARWADRLGGCFAEKFVVAGCLLITAAVVTAIQQSDRVFASAAEIFAPTNWLWLLLTWVALKLLHEMGHAIACHRHGGTVRETGIVLVLFAPLAYVDVTSCWRMNSRWKRIAVAAAGMYVELLIASLALFFWLWVDSPQIEFLLRNLIVTAGISTLLFNANALMRFDGYFILADTIEIPNLYSEGTSAVKRLAKRCFCGLDSPPSSLPPWRRRVVLVYGLAALAWRILIIVSLTIAASHMFAGAGILIAAVGLVLWFAGPLRGFSRLVDRLRHEDPPRLIRMLVVGSSMLLVGWAAMWQLPIPTAVRAAAITIYLPDTVVRSSASGFVTQVAVRNGQWVEAGELLLELENRQLVNRLRGVEIAIAKNELRRRQASQQHDAGLQRVLDDNRRALQERHAQLQEQVRGLRVIAPRPGRVLERKLASTLGTYVREGDPLMWVARRSDKEVVAVVDQVGIETTRRAVGQPVRLTGWGGMTKSGRLERFDPRASDTLPDPSLAASEGGSLAVRPRPSAEQPDDQPSYQLLAPHFLAHIRLDSGQDAAEIPAGMRLYASFGYRTDPLATRIDQALRRLWHQADSARR